MSPPLQITEDTPPDMLAGSMDLCVMLPSGHTVKMSVERSTPMMDLLVQVTTANKIATAGHVIQALGERGVMPYKPSTPIGALDTWTINIVPKNQSSQGTNRKASLKQVNQPFEQTFRLQVHLPRNQLYVTRVSPKTRLSDILLQVCCEKNLDSSRYSLRHPINLDQVLNLSSCLADYKLQEVALVSNRSRPLGVSSVDIMSLQQTDNSGFKNYNMQRNNRSCDGSVSSGSVGGRSLSPTRSDGSSASPPPAPVPNRPIRKRRPAPKPPTAANNNNNINKNNINNSNAERSTNKNDQSSSQGTTQNTVICHSRNSSDSSGYHEASVLSESPESNSLPDSLPRRSKMASTTNVTDANSNNEKIAVSLSRSLSNLTAVGNNSTSTLKSHSTSSSSLASIMSRKKKAAPLPPPLISRMSSVSEETQKQRTPISSAASSSATLDDNDQSTQRKSSTLPASIRVANMTPSVGSTLPPNLKPPAESLLYQSSDPVDESSVTTPSSSASDCLEDSQVEQPKPRPRTVFQADTHPLDSSGALGVGSQPNEGNVNKQLPRKSRKLYPAPTPKPRSLVPNYSKMEPGPTVDNNSTVSDDVNNNTSHNQVSDERTIVEDCVVEEMFETDVKNEKNKVQFERQQSSESYVSCSSNDGVPINSQLEPDENPNETSTSPSAPKAESVDFLSKGKGFSFDMDPEGKDESNRSRMLSVGNLEDVPAFLSANTQLGRWQNMECLVEDSSVACGKTFIPELETGVKIDPSAELRMDDDEIDRIFHNATRDHVSLESGVGDSQQMSTTSLPSPPISLTHAVQEEDPATNQDADSLDWEYKLPAPPTFRDEANSPTVTEYDTVTIGNITEVFGQQTVIQTDSKQSVDVPDLISNKKNQDSDIRSEEEIVKSATCITIKNNEDGTKEKHTEKNAKNKQGRAVFLTNGDSKPDLLKHGVQDKATTLEAEKMAVINELEAVINDRLNKSEVMIAELESLVKKSKEVQHSSALDNFVITTYKETKPVEVFEDDSIKSSNGERRDSSRDEAMFRAPKSIPRRYEPNLHRRSSFSNDDKPVNVTVKRSMSHVSLLAGNVSRGPYRSHLARSNGTLAESSQPEQTDQGIGGRLRKTTSEVNISQDTCAESKVSGWSEKTNSMGLQSLQVLRSILPQLSHSNGCVNLVGESGNEEISSCRVASDSVKNTECTLTESQEDTSSSNDSTKKKYSYTGPPTINLSTWSERPKRQVSIKMDRDYCSGFGKLKTPSSAQEMDTKDSHRSIDCTNGLVSAKLVSRSNSRFEEKLDTVKNSSDLSHVPIVRAVELKKPYSMSNINSAEIDQTGYYNGRSYENLNNFMESECKTFNTYHETIVSPSTTSKSPKTSVSITGSETDANNIGNQSTSEVVKMERFNSVTSLAKKFGQPKARPQSCYLFGSHEQLLEEHEKPNHPVKQVNTSRVLLNASDKKYTSIIGINNADNKAEITVTSKPNQTSRILIKGDDSNNKMLGFKVNGNVCNSIDSTCSSDVRAQSKMSSGGYMEENQPKLSSFSNKINRTPSQNNFTAPMVTGFRNFESKSTTLPASIKKLPSAGIPPPPPVMPTLKPVGERKVKTLPPPQADPRDQLLASIRNFGGKENLKKISSK